MRSGSATLHDTTSLLTGPNRAARNCPLTSLPRNPLCPGGLNRSTQHFYLKEEMECMAMGQGFHRGLHRPQYCEMHLPVHRKAIGPKVNSTIAQSASQSHSKRRNGVQRRQSNVLRMMQRSGPWPTPSVGNRANFECPIVHRQYLRSRLTLAAAQAEKGGSWNKRQAERMRRLAF